MRLLKKSVVLALVLLFSMPLLAQDRYLHLQAIATDSAAIFSSQQLDALKTKLLTFESETTNQLVVLTINDLGSESIEMYANGTFNQNALGQAEEDNGILLLFAKNNREVRIEVGYGLEETITDAIASRIIRNTMIPEFKEERYFQGINLAVDALILYLTDPVALQRVKDEMADAQKKDRRKGLWFMAIFMLVFIGAGGFWFYKTYSNLIEIFRGLFTGKLSFLYALFAAPITLMAVVFSLVFIFGPIVMGFVVYGTSFAKYEYLLDEPLHFLWVVLALFLGAMGFAWYKVKIKGAEEFKISWFKSDSSFVHQTLSSSGSSSYSSGFGSSSGGFSGGGGSSGGGGASGSW